MPVDVDRVERLSERVRGLAYRLKTFPRVGKAENCYYGIEVGAETHTKINALVYEDLCKRYEAAKRELRAVLESSDAEDRSHLPQRD